MGEPPSLQTTHGYLTDAFPRLGPPGRRDRWRLAREQVEQFESKGYVFPIPLLDADQVAELNVRLDGIGERLRELSGRLYEIEEAWLERPREVVLHFLGGWLVDSWLHDLVFHPAITVPLAQLLGTRRLRFWHDQVFWKPPRHPGVVPWHQDYSYWTRTAPPAHITMFITLDDMGADNGGLEYVPGSHRWGLLPAASFGGSRDQIEEALPEPLEGPHRPVPVTLRAGEASIHHALLLHGSGGNFSDRPRRALVLNYMHPDTRCADGSGPLLEGTPPLAEGEIVAGDHFPIALDLDFPGS